MIKALLANHFV